MDYHNDENQNPITPGPSTRMPGTSNESHWTPFHAEVNTPGITIDLDRFDDNDLCVLATRALNTIKQQGIQHIHPFLQQPRQPDVFENAKIEQIICAGLKPQYDGSPEKLLPTLNLIHIRRKMKFGTLPHLWNKTMKKSILFSIFPS
jgi:hypothetical protein